MFSIYSSLYYSSNTVCSVYVWDLGNSIQEGFIVSVLIKNSTEFEKKLNSGIWDSINFIHVTFAKDDVLTVSYKLTTTIILKMNLDHHNFSNLSLSGTFTRQVFKNNKVF